jgi:hypothetical protein
MRATCSTQLVLVDAMALVVIGDGHIVEQPDMTM